MRRTRRLAAVVALSLLMMGAVMAQASQTSRPRLVFGIYPGGGVGTVGPGVAAKPESTEMQLAALRRLRGTQRRFVLHLYAAYEGDAPVEQAAASAAAESAYYANQGFDVELVLRYRPKSRDAATAVPGFAEFTRRVVALLGRNPRLVGVQITNEPNVPGHPDASDGDYPGVVDALVKGVVAAKAQARRIGRRRLAIGFNWAHEANPDAAASFWRALRRRGGLRFRRAVDYIGLDMYPGTWSPLDPDRPPPQAAAAALTSSLSLLRRRYLPMARLSRRVALHVSENGYPTGPSRSPAEQAALMAASVRAVAWVAKSLHVTDYRWFDLRDADSSARSLEGGYGLLRDDYTPKPAFEALRNLVGTFGYQ